MASAIGWILVVSGAFTAAAGLAGLLAPKGLLGLVFGVRDPGAALVFFVRHWGVLIFVVGALVLYSAYAPPIRAAVLSAAALEKFAIVALVFFGPLKRTRLMTAVAATDGLFAVLYVAYLGGMT